MSRREQRELIQRWHDGEALGVEVRQAARLVDDDPDARAWLDSLEDLAGSVRDDLMTAVEQEDFSGYWDAISQRLPAGPLTRSPEGEVLRHAPAAIRRRRPTLRWLLRPAAVLATVLVAALLLHLTPEPGPPSFVVEIIEVNSDGAVVVQEATLDTPVMVSFVESAS